MKRIIGVLFVCLLILFSCTSRKTWSVIHNSYDLADDYPDSALSLLKTIEPSQLKSDKARAEYSLTSAIALGRMKKLKENDSILIPAINYFKTHGTDEQKMKLLYCQAGVNLHLDQPEKYMIMLTQVKALAQKLGDARYIAMSSHVLGHYFLVKAEILDEARKNYSDAITNYHKININKYDASLYQQISKIYFQQHEYHKADSVLHKAWDAAIALKEDMRIPQLHVDYAYLLASKQPADYKNSLIQMQKAGKSIRMRHSKNNAFYAYLLEKEGKKDSVSFYLDYAYKLAKNREDTITIFSFFEQVYAKEGFPGKAYPYLRSIFDYRDSLYRKNKDQSLALAHRDYFLGLSKSLEQKNTHSRNVLKHYVAASVFVLLLLLAAYFLKKRYTDKKIQTLNELTGELSRQLDNKTEENEQLKTKIKDSYQSQFKKLGQLVETTSLSGSYSEKSSLGRKVRDITREISGPEAQKELEDKLNKEIDNIMLHLRDDFSKFKEKDFLFLAYMIIGFDVTQISIVLDMSIGAVYTKRFRLREKVATAHSKHKEQYCRWLL